jgi:aquaporin Z
MLRVLRQHWPEYLIEASGLGIFMISACSFGSLLEHPDSPVHQALPIPIARRALMGLAMASTAIAIIYSPWGKRSGAHLNPSTTLTFWSLGRISTADAIGYAAAQFIGGALGIGAATIVLGGILANPRVHWVATVPGEYGELVALLIEIGISFVLMTVVLEVSNRPRIARFTGICAGSLVAIYITTVAPLSGMSMNPARSFASALPAGTWSVLWIYFAAPITGMLGAAAIYVWRRGRRGVFCAKLHHQNSERCIFCEWRVTQARSLESQG